MPYKDKEKQKEFQIKRYHLNKESESFRKKEYYSKNKES